MIFRLSFKFEREGQGSRITVKWLEREKVGRTKQILPY